MNLQKSIAFASAISLLALSSCKSTSTASAGLESTSQPESNGKISCTGRGDRGWIYTIEANVISPVELANVSLATKTTLNNPVAANVSHLSAVHYEPRSPKYTGYTKFNITPNSDAISGCDMVVFLLPPDPATKPAYAQVTCDSSFETATLTCTKKQ